MLQLNGVSVQTAVLSVAVWRPNNDLFVAGWLSDMARGNRPTPPTRKPPFTGLAHQFLLPTQIVLARLRVACT